MALNLGTLYGQIGLDDAPFADALDGAIEHLKEWGRKGVVVAGTAGLAVAAAVGASIVAGMDLEAGRDKLAAELGLSEAESARVGKIAGQVFAKNYGDSMDDVNDAVASVVSSIKGMRDASGAAVQSATIDALNFSKVFDVDLTRAVQSAGTLMGSGLAKNATQAFDLMTTASQRVPKHLREDILDASDEYSQFFKSLGYNGQQAFGLLVSNADKGMFGIDKAGDAIKEFTIRSTDMSTTSKAAYKTIGLNARDMADQILAGGGKAQGATQKIIDGLLGIKDPATQANTAIALFGTPLEDLNATEVPEFLKSLKGGGDAMDGFGGAAKRMDKTLNANAVASLGSLKRQAQTAFFALGNWALPTVNRVTSALAEDLGPALRGAGDTFGVLLAGAQSAIGFVEDHQTIFAIIAGVITTLLIPALIAWGVQASIAGVKSAAAWVMSMAGALVSAGLHVISLTLITLAWAKTGVQATASALRVAAAWLIAMGPIGIAIALIAGFVVLVIKHWDTIKSKTKAAWDWVVSQVRKVPGLLLSIFLNFTLIGLIIKHWDTIKSTFSKGVNASVAFVRGLPGKAKAALGNLGGLLLGAGEDIMQGLLNGIDNGFDWIRSKLGGLGKLIPGWLKKVLGIHSPSTVMRDEVGRWIPAGVADGVDAGMPVLRRAIEAMGDNVVVPITSAMSYGVRTNARQQTVDLAATGTDGMPARQGASVVVDVHTAPGMSETQVGDAAANAIDFVLTGPQ